MGFAAFQTRPHRTGTPFEAPSLIGALRCVHPNRRCRRSSAAQRILPRAQNLIPGPLYMGASPLDRTRLYAANRFPSNFVPFPLRVDLSAKRTPPLVRVRLSVEFRVHSRQMLCVGGSAIPFGWSFLSIAKVPMSWGDKDIWVVDVELPAGSRVEYKYVVLEEQDWTRQVNEAAEGRVEYTYRVTPDDTPPDVQHITKQMAIVAWQSGSNRVLQIPGEAELAALVESGAGAGDRPMASAQGSTSGRSYGQQALGKGIGGGSVSPNSTLSSSSSSSSSSSEWRGDEVREDDDGVWERLTIDSEGRPFLERRDVWGRGENPENVE